MSAVWMGLLHAPGAVFSLFNVYISRQPLLFYLLSSPPNCMLYLYFHSHAIILSSHKCFFACVDVARDLWFLQFVNVCCTYTNLTFTYVRMISLCIHETLAWICSAESAECPVHFPSTLLVMNSAQGTCLHVYDSTHPCIPVHPSTHPSIHLSIHLSLHHTSSIYSSMHPST